MRSLTLALVALLLLAAAPVRSQPEGDDFPDRWEDAVDVAPGTYEGTLGPADREDWVRVALPPGMGLRAVFAYERTDFVGLSLLTDAGREARSSFGWEEVGSLRILTYDTGPLGHVRVGVKGSSPAAYALTLTPIDLPDPAVTGLRVRPALVETPLGLVESPTRRVVEVDVANLGLVPAPLHVAVRAESASARGVVDIVATKGLTLDAGARRTLVFEWEGVGAGDVDFLAAAYLPALFAPELTLDNNALRTRHHLVAPGDGWGIVAPL